MHEQQCVLQLASIFHAWVRLSRNGSVLRVGQEPCAPDIKLDSVFAGAQSAEADRATLVNWLNKKDLHISVEASYLQLCQVLVPTSRD